MEEILLSVLIPSIPRRQEKLQALLDNLQGQDDPALEVIVLTDNCRRPLGYKRNTMMDLAQGRFLCHIDDDEDLAASFVEDVVGEVRRLGDSVDVIAYDAQVTIDDKKPFKVFTKLGSEVEAVQEKLETPGEFFDIWRPPWHWCTWRTELAKQYRFPDYYYGEDWHWLRQVLPVVKGWRKIDKVLFFHRHSSTDSSSNFS